MHLWSLDSLTDVISGANTYLLVPDGARLLAIDGETQLTAHFQLHGTPEPELRRAHGDFPLAAVVHHGVRVDEARQYFHDLNVLAVRPSTSLSLSMNTSDPLMKVVGDLEAAIPFLTGRVDKQARQLTKASTKVLTIHALRQMAVNVAKGIAGIQYGAKPAPVDDIDLDDVFRVSRDWLTAIFNTFSAEITDRETYLIGASPVLAAIGALGHRILQSPSYDRQQVLDETLASLRTVDWKKSARWTGIAGKPTPKGVFSVSGTKEVGYAIYNVLADPDNPNYSRVRDGAPRSHTSQYAGEEFAPVS
jgi:DNA sulfur modification protein DndB